MFSRLFPKGIKKQKLLDIQGVSVWRAARVQGGRLSLGGRLSGIASDSFSLYGSTGGKPFTERFSFRPFESFAVLKN